MADSKRVSVEQNENRSVYVTIAAYLVVLLLLALIVFISAPFGDFLGTDQFAFASGVHGLLATLGLIVGSVSLYLGWRLFIGKIKAFADLKILLLLSTLAVFGTIIFGNWIYIAYRAPGGVRAYLLQNYPEIHNVFFEFKEFIALFTFPLFLAATYVVWRYSNHLINNKPLRTWTFVVISIAWIALMIAFILGAAITKIKSV